MTTHSSSTATISTDKAAREEILARIRETSGMHTDLEQLAKVSALAG